MIPFKNQIHVAEFYVSVINHLTIWKISSYKRETEERKCYIYNNLENFKLQARNYIGKKTLLCIKKKNPKTRVIFVYK